MKYLSQSKNILGGALVIAGTRIPLTHIIFLLEQGHTYDSISQTYPDIDISRIQSAVKEAKEILDSLPHNGYGQTSSQT